MNPAISERISASDRLPTARLRLTVIGRLLSMLTLVCCISSTLAQSSANIQALQKAEDSLKIYADRMIQSADAAHRFRADSLFVRGLVRALKTPYSFSFPFDSIRTVSRLYAPDSSFRIFTWQLKKDEYVYLQKGAIQMKTRDGALKLFPLFDYSMFTPAPEDSIRSIRNWIGAIYYNMVMKEHQGKKYYTLLGFDDFSISSNKKWIEVLSFNDRGEPVFGGPYFVYPDSAKQTVGARFCMEYKKETGTLLNYDPSLDLIVFDHLISETDEPEKKNTYIPDGSYEAFRWQQGRWVYQERVFDFSLEDGQFPVEEQLLDEKGNENERKLNKASQRNIERSRKKN